MTPRFGPLLVPVQPNEYPHSTEGPHVMNHFNRLDLPHPATLMVYPRRSRILPTREVSCARCTQYRTSILQCVIVVHVTSLAHTFLTYYCKPIVYRGVVI